ncbi:hypothetical protein KPL78_15355 [Roseomonas sp. HJA6]|uniref:Uncharacterized protein n=1 Tax=Roseomonas alba TaxID=2846776 RepID=A0ABS7AAB2_9PROT|nr:hypothetical protein [Neoroseomonas alba]MBW6399238.1 hypothetical protein [Neoroseomonas alba]
MTDAPEDGTVARDWVRLATFACAALSCALSAACLVVVMGGVSPQVTTAAHAATPARAEPLPPGNTPHVLVAVELLLPHLPRPAPFPRSFATAVALAAGDAEATRLLLPLAAAAADGAPTLRQLAEDFGPAADALVLAEMGFGPDAGWFARRTARTMRLGAEFGAAGTPGLTALRDAAERLAEEDGPGAEAALAPLPQGAAPALDAWRARLARRLAADAARVQLAELAMARAQGTSR